MGDRRAFWMFLAILGRAGFGGSGCRSDRSPSAIFPAKVPATVLRIRDPILRPDLAVEAVVHGQDGTQTTIWMLLDSGATIGSLPVAVVAALRLVDQRPATMLGINGLAKTSVMVAPWLELAGLRLSSVAFLVNTLAGPAAELGVIGQSVLSRMPWEISWDRGVVTLGAQPWPDAADVSSVPLEPFAAAVETATVRLNGRPLKMMLDTGAVVSAIPDSAASELGLHAEPLSGHLFGGASGTFRADRVYTADIELGTAKLKGQRFMSSVSRNLAVLGRDILGQFNVMIFPGQRLFLRPRGDLRLTAETRVRRWPWMPACLSPGCIRARVEPGKAAGRLEIALEAALPGPIDILFGCAARPMGTEVIEASGQRAIAPDAAGPQRATSRHLLLHLESPRTGETDLGLADAGDLRVSADGPPCRELTVLDVAPARRGGDARAQVYARLVR
ncbi:MAG: aspartyl protease family protein [Polyangia bacterium]